MRLFFLLSAFTLAACGGSGGGEDAPEPAPTPPVNALDLDGDGRLRYPWGPDRDDDGDGAVSYMLGGTDYDDANAAVQRNAGGGAFAPPVPYPVGDTPTGLALGDLNGDGNLDVVVSNQDSDDLTVLLGNGDGTLGVLPSVPLPVGGGPTVIADFNEDGHLDVVAASLFLLLGDGTGEFGPPSTLTWSASLDAHARDVNGDGHLDLMGLNYFNGLVTMLGKGDGTFGAPTEMPVANATSLAVGDLDGNGTWDAVLGQASNDTVGLLAGAADGTFGPPTIVSTPDYVSRVDVRDFDANGHADVFAWGQDDLMLLPGNGAGGVGAPLQSPTGAFASISAVADLNGDGIPDLAVPDQFAGLLRFYGAGDGTFTAAAPIPGSAFAAAVGDLNNDGRLDLLVLDASADVLRVLIGI